MDKIYVQLVNKPEVNPVKLIANATRLTFKPGIPFSSTFMDDENKLNKYDVPMVQNLISADHSPLEHCSYSILVAGASRSFLAQIRTHRLASFTSASQHYINWKDADYEVPIEVFEKCEELNSVEPLKYFIDEYTRSQKAYIDVQEKFGFDHSVARQLTEQSMRNNLLITANVREWLTILGLRECGRNTSEIAYVSWLIRNALTKECPEIFGKCGPSCFRAGKCKEGKLCCGKPWVNGINPEEDRWEHCISLGQKWRNKLSQ